MTIKILLPLSLFCVIYGTVTAQGLTWSSPVSVADATYGNIRPRIGLTTGNIPVVTWGDLDGTIYTSRLDGASFITPLKITPDGFAAFTSNWTSAEMDAKGDTVFVVYTENPIDEGHAYIVKSVDGGITFSDTIQVDHIGTDVSRFPYVKIGESGNPIVDFMRLTSTFSNAEYVVTRSEDGGTTFLPDVSVSGASNGEVCDCCPATMAVSGNRVAVLYRNNYSGIRDMYAGISQDGAESFPISGDIDNTDWVVNYCPSSGPSGIITGDSLVYTFMSGASGPLRVYLGTASLDDGGIGLQQVLVDQSGVNDNYPIIAGNEDTMAIVFQRTGSGKNKSVIASSINGAPGLGSDLDTIPSAGNAINPHAVYAGGTFHIVYQDTDDDEVKYLTAKVAALTSDQPIMASPDHLSITPNPFSSSGIVQFSLSETSAFKIELFDFCGMKIRTILSGNSRSDSEKIFLEKGNLPPGIYFLVLTSESGQLTKKLVIE